MSQTNTYFGRKGFSFSDQELKEAKRNAAFKIAASLGTSADDLNINTMLDFASSIGQEISYKEDQRLTRLAKKVYAEIHPEAPETWDSLTIKEQDRYRAAVEVVEDELDKELED